jgi:hypothetical protein
VRERILGACAAALAWVVVGASAASASALHVIPFPGTPDASPSTEVIFSSLAPDQLSGVRVTGAHTGAHQGALDALPDGAGTAFVPTAGFAPGERVTVHAALASLAAGAAIGDAGSTRLSFSFTAGRNPRVAVPHDTAGVARASADTRSFQSAPGLHPVSIKMTSDPDHSSGDIFLAPFNTAQPGPMILDGQGRLVWFHPVSGGEAMNLQVQQFEGKPVLTWWQGPLAVGHGTIYGLGEDVIANSSYGTIAVVHGANGYTPDLHEFQITPKGTALVDEYVPVHENLSRLGGTSNGTVLDCVIQELDIKTGKVLWEWHSLGHVPLRRSYFGAPTNPDEWWDYFHMNSIQQLPDGNILVSSRSTWAIYEISHTTGHIIWTLGGKHSSFTMGAGTRFEWQHDARMHPGGILSLFDDASDPPEESEGSAKFISLNRHTMTARLVSRYTHNPPLLPGLAGNAELLPNRDVFVGWGGSPDFSEFGPGGRQILNGTFPNGVGTYRAFRFHWTGRPLTRPAISVTSGPARELTVYASWNGATQVARWQVLGGSSSGSLHALGTSAPRRGFETTITVHGHPARVAVQALGSGGQVLGTSLAQSG